MARKKGAINSFPSLWAAHETLYFEVFSEALNLLEITAEQRNNEDDISEVLYLSLHEICFKHKDDIMTPCPELPKSPVEKNEIKGGKKRKRPDFTCNFVNPMAASSITYMIPFHIECKRLGDGNLTKKYVTDGITRFDIKSHEYGKRAPSGMMIGYIISSTPASILIEVNKHLNNKFPELEFSFSRKVVSENQELVRTEVLPIEFKIIHLWVNLN